MKPDDAGIAPARWQLGHDLFLCGRPGEAVSPLEQALALQAPQGDPVAADARFDLGRALFALGDVVRGRDLVRQARAAYTAKPDAVNPDMAAEANRWWAAHGR
jgi:hypothetical protein